MMQSRLHRHDAQKRTEHAGAADRSTLCTELWIVLRRLILRARGRCYCCSPWIIEATMTVIANHERLLHAKIVEQICLLMCGTPNSASYPSRPKSARLPRAQHKRNIKGA